MAFFTRNDLGTLLDVRASECVSFYLPTHRSAPDSLQDPIRFSNLVTTAEQRLKEAGLRTADVRELLEPAEELKESSLFWTHQRDGLAVFLSKDFSRLWRLPTPVQEEVVVDDHFHVAQLLPLLQNNRRYHVLAVSPKSCRMFTGDRDDFEELAVETLPDDLQSALGWSREKQLNLHSMQPGSGGVAMYHGHEEEAFDSDREAYFRQVDSALCHALDGDDAPVIFAGVEESFPAYRELTQLKQLVNKPLAGNPDNLSLQTLHEKSWALIRPLFRKRETQTLEAFTNQLAHGRATEELPAILAAARDGLVETLLISREPAEDDDLLDVATLRTLQTGGSVVTVPPEDLPHGQPAAALLRAPLAAIAGHA